MLKMHRRELMTLLGIATATSLSWQHPARAQQPDRIRRIGFLTPRSRPSQVDHDAFSAAFLKGMSDLGYGEGKNLLVEWRYADGDYKRLAGFATELVGMNLAVIVTYGTAAARVLQATTKTIPVVVAAAVDLVGARIVESLARPGGNITGLSVIDVDMSSKQLELLKAFLPALRRVAVLSNPGNPANPLVLKHVAANASALGVEVVAVNATTPQAIETAFAEAAGQGAGAVIIAADAFFSGQGPQIAASAARHRLPTISLYRDHVLAGGLISYGQNVAEFHRQAARYVDRILKGAKPENLPVEQPTKFDLLINSKTAARLGLAIPPELLVSADEVIE
jgi:putative tryptophan/tyrosine transport system substrate-binding protein